MAKLLFGCGYLGSRVLARWLAQGEQVDAVTRRQQRAEELAGQGARPIVADVTRPDSLAHLPIAETVLFAVGFDRARYESIHEVYAAGLRAVLDALPKEGGPVIYLSSTGVYGQDDGRWVDEDSPTEPQREGGRACLAAERILAAHPRGVGGTILRLAGIYGPGRLPRREALLAGEPIPPPRDGYVNLIHVDDAVSAILAAEERRGPLRTFVVSDGHPAAREEYFTEVARLIGAPDPVFADPHQAPPTPRGTTSKRASNSRMLAELGVELQFPSYREGLAAILGAT